MEFVDSKILTVNRFKFLAQFFIAKTKVLGLSVSQDYTTHGRLRAKPSLQLGLDSAAGAAHTLGQSINSAAPARLRRGKPDADLNQMPIYL